MNTPRAPHKEGKKGVDGKVRASHAALDGIILPADHPFWRYHTPPWEWNCRCETVGIIADEAEEEEARDKLRQPEVRRVLGEVEQRQLAQGSLNRGPSTNVDVRTPKERGGSYQWSARDAGLPYEEIATRWDAQTRGEFERWAGQQAIPGGSNLMQWLAPSAAARAGNPATLGEFMAAAPEASVAASTLAKLLRSEPEHPLSQAIKLWGDDDQRFTEMMMQETAEAENWRHTMGAALRKLAPVDGAPVLYRGWSFETPEEMQAFIRQHRDGFVQDRVGMSASFDASVASREKFSSGEGRMIWVLEGNRSARDMRPLFEAVDAKAYREHEQEAIIPASARFIFADEQPVLEERKDSAGNKRMFNVFYLQEF